MEKGAAFGFYIGKSKPARMLPPAGCIFVFRDVKLDIVGCTFQLVADIVNHLQENIVIFGYPFDAAHRNLHRLQPIQVRRWTLKNGRPRW